MSRYLNSLEDEEYRPPSTIRTRSSATTRHRNGRQQQQQEEEEDEFHDESLNYEEEWDRAMRGEGNERTTNGSSSANNGNRSNGNNHNHNNTRTTVKSSNKNKKKKKSVPEDSSSALSLGSSAHVTNGHATNNHGSTGGAVDIFDAYQRLRNMSPQERRAAMEAENGGGGGNSSIRTPTIRSANNNHHHQQTPPTSTSTTQLSSTEDDYSGLPRHSVSSRQPPSISSRQRQPTRRGPPHRPSGTSSSSSSNHKNNKNKYNNNLQTDAPSHTTATRVDTATTVTNSSRSESTRSHRHGGTAVSTTQRSSSSRSRSRPKERQPPLPPDKTRPRPALSPVVQHNQAMVMHKNSLHEKTSPTQPKKKKKQTTTATTKATAAKDHINNTSIPKTNHVVPSSSAKQLAAAAAPPPLYPPTQELYHVQTNNNKKPKKERIPSPSLDTSFSSHSTNSDDEIDDSNMHDMNTSRMGRLGEESFHLSDDLQEGGGLRIEYSNRMDSVKDNLRTSMMVTNKNHKNNKSKKGMSDESGKSIAGGFLKLKHPKHKLTDEEKKNKHNPFLNRPTAFKTNNEFGYINEVAGHQSGDEASNPGLTGDPNEEMTEHGDEEPEDTRTLQQKYCPLPKPVLAIQQFVGVIVTNQTFQIIMVVLIMVNALVLGIATYDFTNPKIPEALDYMDKILLVIFTIELALQFIYCGYTLFLDPWLVFDALTIVTSWWLEEFQVFRSFRIFRSFRLVVRLPLLKNLVLTVFHVMPRIYSILALMLLIMYIYGVLCTVLFGDMFEEGLTDVNYFGRLDISVFTLFQMVTLEGWGDVVRQVAAEHPWYGSMIFVSFIVTTAFIMYNLIVAVMCDSMLVVEAQSREEAKQAKRERKRKEELLRLEEEKELKRQMLEQRKEIARLRAKGLVKDDDSETNRDSWMGDSTSYMDDLMEGEDEQSVVEMRDHCCDNCGYMAQIPKIPAADRRRNKSRDALMHSNQERVKDLHSKIDALTETHLKVTAILQTLVLEIEASREHMFNNYSIGNMSQGSLEVE